MFLLTFLIQLGQRLGLGMSDILEMGVLVMFIKPQFICISNENVCRCFSFARIQLIMYKEKRIMDFLCVVY